MRTAAFVVIGAGYGIALRVWMRFISTDPEFTWGGTIAIVAVFTILGLSAGLADAGRRRGWRWRLRGIRVVGSVLGLGCFLAAGAAMFPTIIPAALGVARRDWNRWVRRILVAGGAVFGVYTILGLDGLALGHRLVALVLYAGFCAVEVRLFALLFAPQVRKSQVSLES